MTRDIQQAAHRLSCAYKIEIRDIALRDPDMIRDVARAAIRPIGPKCDPSCSLNDSEFGACSCGAQSSPAPLPEDVRGLVEARDTAQSAVEAWAGVVESLEAHLQDRVAMQDEANPERYLRILQSGVANVQHASKQIRAARWAANARYREENDRLTAEIARLQALPQAGFVMVPVEPTEAMLQGACSNHKPGQPMSRGRPEECPAIARRRRCWSAMLSARPTEGAGHE